MLGNEATTAAQSLCGFALDPGELLMPVFLSIAVDDQQEEVDHAAMIIKNVSDTVPFQRFSDAT